MIGRKKEKERIERVLKSDKAAFLAVTGRRRVGKTYLIDTLLKEHYCFSLTGIQNANLKTQLLNFAIKLAEYKGEEQPIMPENWQMAFLQLKNYLKTLDKNQKQVIFIDELPWLATAKSGLTQMLAHFWNDYLSKESHFILVICGSATSWITKKIVQDTGGLHNRITENIHLYPFDIQETNDFLQQKGLRFSIQDTVKIQMTLGGIPFYLEHIQKGETFATAIERICFAPTGILYHEYDNLFKALFNNAELHQDIVQILATEPYGMTHAEILEKLSKKEATGAYSRAMEELIMSDFVLEYPPFGKKQRNARYKLSDEYCNFYHRFIRPNYKKYTQGIWLQLADSQQFKIWSGYAFENFCHKHIDKIKAALGIAAVFTQIYYLHFRENDEAQGVQIDLLIDRKDNAMNLCEIKFHQGNFLLSKTDYQQLQAKKQRLIAHTKTKKQVFLTLICNNDINTNEYSNEIIDVSLSLEQIVKI